MLKLWHVRRTVSYMLLGKSVIGGGFAVLTLCGVTLPAFGLEFTTGRELAATGVGGVLGAALALLRA